MEILKIGIRLSFEMLSEACKKQQEIVIPVTQNGHNGEEHQSYINISLEEVKPLETEGCCFFKGLTVPTNGEKPLVVDGATSMVPKEIGGHNYGHFAIYD